MLSSGLMLIIGYAVAINLIAYALFGFDKRQAIMRRRRVPEATLLMAMLSGGWMGGWMARNAFRHKTRKWFFTTMMGAATLANVLALGVWVTAPISP